MEPSPIFRIVALLVLMVSPGMAMEPREEPIVVNADEIEYFKDQHLVVGTGNVKVEHQGSVLTADKMQVDTLTKDAEAWGHVELRREGTIYRGSHGTYNFESREGHFEETAGETFPWYLAAKTVDKPPQQEKYVAKRGYVTTCDVQPPHYRIAARKALIYPKDKVITHNNTFFVGKVPIFWFPYFYQPLTDRHFPLSVIHGSSHEWGRYLLTAYRYRLWNEQVEGHLRVDYRQKRGVAYGWDVRYRTSAGEGIFRTYYLDDRLKQVRLDPIRGDLDRRTYVEDNNRYRFQLRHRWQIDRATLAVLEYHKAGDRNFLRDFFFREEYQIDPQPTSFLSIIHTQPEYTVSLVGQKRINKFEGTTEQLPLAQVDVNNWRLGESNFYYSSSTSVGNYQQKNGDSDVDHHVTRLHTSETLSWALRLPFGLNVSPSVGTTQSWYSTDLFGDNHLPRASFFTGMNVSNKFFKVLTTRSMSPLGMEINGLRHVVTPTATYTYRHAPTVEPSQLPLNGVDGLDRSHNIVYGLENKLQTKRQTDQGLETVDLARFLLSTDFLFRGRTGELGFQSVSGDLELKPTEWLGIEADSGWSYRKRIFTSFNLDVWLNRDWWRTGAGYRWTQNRSSQLDLGAQVKLAKWKFKVFERIQFKRLRDDGSKSINNLLEQEYRIIRDLHCWEVEIVYNIDGTTMGRTIMVALRPKAFPDLPFSYGTHVRAPKDGRHLFVRPD